MADLKKFEEMLERLVNEDKAGAEELFHEIVVEKSREIYENLLEDDLDDEAVDEATDEEVDESDDEDLDEATDEEVDESDDEDLDEDTDDKEVDEGFNLDEFEVEADPMAPAMDDMGGDPADDMMGDVEADPEMDDEGEDDGDVEDRVEDLEDALDDLKAEFDKMMSGDDEGDDEAEDEPEMDMDAEEEPEEEAVAFESDDEEVDEATDDDVEETSAPKSNTEQMREYVEKVVAPKGEDNKSKSTVASANNMGGTASNLNQGDTGDVVEAGKGALKGNAVSDQNAKEDDHGNVNKPGAKAGKAQSAVSAGHGAEKKGAGETADNKKSTIGS